MIPDEHRTNAPERYGQEAIDTTYPAIAEAVGAARASVGGWLRNLAVAKEVVADVVLAVSEACTNAVVHGYRDRPTGTFRLVGDRVGGDVRVIVSDNGCGLAPRLDSPGLGAGLPLMAMLAKSLEVRRAAGGHGTVVTMAFATAEDRSTNGDHSYADKGQRTAGRDQFAGDRDQSADAGDLAAGRFDARPHADGLWRRPSDQREQDARARRQASAARAEAAWLGALASRARKWTGSTRDQLRLPTQRGDRLVGPPPTHR